MAKPPFSSLTANEPADIQTCNRAASDLKADNVMLCADYRPAVADFGMSKAKSMSTAQSTAMHGRGGTSRWSAPETFTDGHKKFTEACDIYSFSMLMLEVLTRKIPFDGKNQNQFMMAFTMKHERPDLGLVEPGCPGALQELMVRCWSEDPAARPAECPRR